MKKLYIISWLLIPLFLYAKNSPQQAPVNPEYTKYIQNKTEGSIIKTTYDGYKLGYRPSPLYIKYDIPQRNKSNKLKSSESFPAKYDLRTNNYVTGVRNQGQIGACWTFGVIGSIESALKVRGKGDMDLSEENMATCHGFEWGKNEGGNFEIATAYLNSFKGPLTETQDPYTQSTFSFCKTDGMGYTPAAYIPEARWLGYNIDNIKRAVMQYGGVAVSIKMGDYNLYYNTKDYTYYYGGEANSDHGVMIVGWDDSKVITGGTASPKGTNVGAWIVKNSWGNSWGENGYFYVSYKDASIARSSIYFPTVWNSKVFDKMFYYDELGIITSIGYSSYEIYGLIKYNATEKTFINRIGTYVLAGGTTVDIEIYQSKTGDSLSNLLGTSKGNMCGEAGYYLFDIAAVVNGDFYIKIKYSCPYFSYLLPVEMYWKDYADPVIESNVCWLSEDGKKWEAAGKGINNNEYDICVRAYGDKIIDTYPYFTVSKNEICVNNSVTYTDVSDGTINSYSWNFGNGASPQTANTKGPHQVTYSTPGAKTVTLTVETPNGPKIMTRENILKVNSNIFVYVPYDSLFIARGKEISLNAFGADEYSWSPNTYLLSGNTGQTVKVKPEDTITYTVTGTSGSCTDSDKITVVTLPNPINDDACNALEVNIGTNGLYTNLYATTEPGEPYPPLNGCKELLSWCDEYGHGKNPLDNSVWFYFIATSAGKASFWATNFDNQMAVYQAETCQDLFTKNYTLIGANDDYFAPDGDIDPRDYPPSTFAAAIDLVNLIPGKKYWIQVDGSGGGKVGIFNLIISEHGLGINDAKMNKQNISIYPNPSSGLIYLKSNEPLSENINIEIYSTDGKIVYFNNFISNGQEFSTSIDLKSCSKGMYLIKAITSTFIDKQIIVIQ
jgi:C1A family cysteine protease